MLENLYLCGSNNNIPFFYFLDEAVVICLKICTFAVATTTGINMFFMAICCDLLENLYLCGSNNNIPFFYFLDEAVVICLKICTFAVATTTGINMFFMAICCDLLENLYLCGSNNNLVFENLCRPLL